MEQESLKSSFSRHTSKDGAMMPNYALERTAASELRRLAVPSSLRSSATAQRER
jgi:hypothetical protein